MHPLEPQPLHGVEALLAIPQPGEPLPAAGVDDVGKLLVDHDAAAISHDHVGPVELPLTRQFGLAGGQDLRDQRQGDADSRLALGVAALVHQVLGVEDVGLGPGIHRTQTAHDVHGEPEQVLGRLMLAQVGFVHREMQPQLGRLQRIIVEHPARQRQRLAVARLGALEPEQRVGDIGDPLEIDEARGLHGVVADAALRCLTHRGGCRCRGRFGRFCRGAFGVRSLRRRSAGHQHQRSDAQKARPCKGLSQERCGHVSSTLPHRRGW